MDHSRTSFILDADLLTLRSFLAIIEQGSFSAAARQVGRTQSAVSLQIARLEERMRVSLLERTSRSVKLTPEGEVFASYVRKIVALSDEGFAAVTGLDATEPLRIGIAEYLVPQHLQRLLTRIKRSFPNTMVALTLGVGGDLYEELMHNELDMAITCPMGDNGIQLFSEPLVWVGSANYTQEDPAVLDIIQMKAPCVYRKAATDALESAGITWKEGVRVNNIQGILAAVAAGFGISSVPKSAVVPAVEIIRDNMPQLPKTGINLYWNSTNPHPLLNRCTTIIKEELKTIGLF